MSPVCLHVRTGTDAPLRRGLDAFGVSDSAPSAPRIGLCSSKFTLKKPCFSIPLSYSHPADSISQTPSGVYHIFNARLKS